MLTKYARKSFLPVFCSSDFRFTEICSSDFRFTEICSSDDSSVKIKNMRLKWLFLKDQQKYKISSFKSSGNFQKKEVGTHISVSNNQFSSVTLHELESDARENMYSKMKF